MKLVEMKCKNCGAVLEVEEGTKQIKCNYCGSNYQLDDEVTHIQYDNAQEAGYDFEKGRQKAASEKTIQKMPLIVVGAIIAGIFLFFTVCIAIGKVNEEPKPEINPFDYLEISFEGTSGEGKVKVDIKDNNDNISLNDFSYKWTKDVNLSEGDTTTINVESNNYNLSEKTKKYTVTGLSTYLNNLDLSPETINNIHILSTDLTHKIPYNLKSLLDRKYVKLYLITDNKNKNTLYDVEQVTTNRNETYYIVAYYQKVIYNKNNNSISYNSSMYMGNQVSGTLVGYRSLDELKTEITTKMSSDMQLIEKDL